MSAWTRRFVMLLAFAGSGWTADPPPFESLAAHPRLMITDQELRALRTAPADPLRTALKTYIDRMAAKAGLPVIESAATILADFHRQNPTAQLSDWQNLSLRKCRRVQGLILHWAMASRIRELVDVDLVTSKLYGQLAIRQMMEVAQADFAWDFTADNTATGGRNYPTKLLNVAEMMFGVAVGLDWLWNKPDWWFINGKDQRVAVARALYTKGLRTFYQGDPAQASGRYLIKGAENWAQVANASALAAALALAHSNLSLGADLPEETVNILASRTIDDASDSLLGAQIMYAPAGAYAEGLGYWNYGTSYQIFAIAMLESALGGRDAPWIQRQVQPLWDHNGFRSTSWFRVSMVGPTGLGFTYSDTGVIPGKIIADDDPSLALTWLTQRFEQPDLEGRSRRNLADDHRTIPSAISDSTFFTSYCYPLHYVWMPSPSTAGGTSGPLDHRFSGQPLGQRETNAPELAILRNDRNDAKSLWVAVKAGASGLGHAHADLGSFCLDQAGVRWAEDLGADDYAQDGYFEDEEGGRRWSYLFCGVEGHNVLSPGSYPQALVALAPITGFSATPNHAWTTVDLTQIYPGVADRHVRGIELIDQRQQVLIQDDLARLRPGIPLTWRMMTAATVTVETGHLVLSRVLNGITVRMILEVLQPAGTSVTIQRVDNLPGHRERFPGYSRISIRIPPRSSTGDTQVVINLRPASRTRLTIPVPRARSWDWIPESALAPPVITSPTRLIGYPGKPLVLPVTATNGPWTSITVEGLPSWMEWQADKATLVGVVPADAVAPIQVTVRATNTGGTGSATVTIAPAADVLPRLITVPLTGQVGQPLGTTPIRLLTNTLPNNPLPGSLQSLRSVGLPPGLAISINGRLSGTPTRAGTYRVLLTMQTVYGTTQGTITLVILPEPGRTMTAIATATPDPLDLP